MHRPGYHLHPIFQIFEVDVPLLHDLELREVKMNRVAIRREVEDVPLLS